MNDITGYLSAVQTETAQEDPIWENAGDAAEEPSDTDDSADGTTGSADEGTADDEDDKKEEERALTPALLADLELTGPVRKCAQAGRL